VVFKNTLAISVFFKAGNLKHSAYMDFSTRYTALQILLWEKPYIDMAVHKSVFPY
jgi:hypothetical protein